MGLEYDDQAAERLEAIYLGPDVKAQRDDTVHRIAVQKGERVLDIGSGPGFLATALADQTGPSGKVVGVDISQQMIDRAVQRNQREWLSYQRADAAELPFEDNSFDVVVSTQVAEYVPDVGAFASEVHRVLKPNGRGLILATDWEGICWYSAVPERMEKVLKAFAPHCADSKLPRTLTARLRKVGLAVKDVSYFPIINVDRYEGCYGQMVVPLIRAFVASQRTVPEEELQAWEDEQVSLNARGEHFFSSGRFSFSFGKPL